MKINVNYHSSIQINDIYIDPYMIKEESHDARIVFITHSHHDHCSKEDIDKVINDKTIIFGPKDVCEELKEYYDNIWIIEANREYLIEDIAFKTFLSYNTKKGFHRKCNGWVGYLIEIEKVTYCICGDSDITDELKGIKCDVLFVPIGGKYTMDAKDASYLTNLIKPKLVIPVHYNAIVGTKEDERIFIEGLNNIEYKIFL